MSQDSLSEGPIRCIFMCEFHPTAGPKIRCQVPENYIAKEVFDLVSVYMIPKAQLQKCTLTVTLEGYKILGYPIKIDNKKYVRNAFHFNLCLVFAENAHTVQYEPLLKKLSEYILAMEMNHEFLSQPTTQQSDVLKPLLYKPPHIRDPKRPIFISDTPSTESNFDRLLGIMKHVKNDINSYQMCVVTDGPTSLHLTVVDLPKDPAPVLDYHVPILTGLEEKFDQDQWDLTTHQILPYIDGFTHISKIACKAEVHPNLVKACIQNLVCYNVVRIIPLFQYCNVYTPTQKINSLISCKELQQKCIEYCSSNLRHHATIRDIFRMYSGMGYGISLRDLCARLNPNTLRINERNLVQFGLLHGIIRKINKYPVSIGAVNGKPDFNGCQSMEEICCSLCVSNNTLEKEIEIDPATILLWR